MSIYAAYKRCATDLNHFLDHIKTDELKSNPSKLEDAVIRLITWADENGVTASNTESLDRRLLQRLRWWTLMLDVVDLLHSIYTKTAKSKSLCMHSSYGSNVP
jgi:hypothetical protein